MLRGINNDNRSSTAAKYGKPMHFYKTLKDFTAGMETLHCTCITTFQNNKQHHMVSK